VPASPKVVNVQVFPLDIMGNTQRVVVSILVDGVPIQSTDGAVWDKHEIMLDAGEELPFAKKLNVMWDSGLKIVPVRATVRVANPYGAESVYQIDSVTPLSP